MFKKTIFIFVIALLITSCGDSFDSVKRGLTGTKKNSTDEFMIQKKDPLILPPDYENLPSPEEGEIANQEEFSIFEKTLDSSVDESSSQSGSAEESILKKIRRK
jgi:hypothetical protein